MKGGEKLKVITDSEFRAQIKKDLGTGYLFYGEEDYLKAHAISLIKDKVSPDPAYAFFNIIKLDILDYTPEKLTDALMPPPMMADRKLITLTGFDFTALKQSEIDELCSVLSLVSEYDYNTVVISVASECIDEGYSPAKPSDVINKLSEYLQPVIFEKSTPAKLSSWVARHFSHSGVKISSETVNFLIDYCGTSMYRLSNEIEKLCAYVLYSGRNEVTDEDIRYVAVAGVDFDAFALTDAIMEERASDALAVLDFLKSKKVDPLIIFGEISRTFCDLLIAKNLAEDGMTPFEIGKAKLMNEYRAKICLRRASKMSREKLCRKIKLCAEADKQLKLSPRGYSPIEMLICSK